MSKQGASDVNRRIYTGIPVVEENDKDLSDAQHMIRGNIGESIKKSLIDEENTFHRQPLVTPGEINKAESKCNGKRCMIVNVVLTLLLIVGVILFCLLCLPIKDDVIQEETFEAPGAPTKLQRDQALTSQT